MSSSLTPPDNLWRVDASGEKSSLVWRQEELLLQYTPLATPKVTFPDWPGRGFEELPRRWWELDLSPPTRSIPFSPVPPKPKLAFVIDDWGHRWEAAEGFLELQVPMTFAVLPYLPKTSEHAARAAAAGYEVILHLPMEPHGGIDPGQGAILTGAGGSRDKAAGEGCPGGGAPGHRSKQPYGGPWPRKIPG